jgi:hypothetical protein
MRSALLAVVVVLAFGGFAEAGGTLGGRIVFQQGGRSLPPGQLEGPRSGPVEIDFRSGRQVLTVQPDASGLFSVPAAAGTYRVEYVQLAGQAEFFAPYDVAIGDATLTCIGTLELSLGAPGAAGNPGGGLRVIDDCAQLAPALRRQAGWNGPLTTGIARAGQPLLRSRALVDLLVGARVEAAGSLRRLGSVAGSLVYPFTGTLGSESTWIASLSAGALSAAAFDTAAPSTPVAPYGALGFGFSIQIAEFGAFAGYVNRTEAVRGGPIVGFSGRLHVRFLGLGGRVQHHPGWGKAALFLTFDVSPVGLLGALL